MNIRMNLRLCWVDERLSFSAQDFFNMSWGNAGDKVPIRSSKVWTPDVTVMNEVGGLGKLLDTRHSSPLLLSDDSFKNETGVNVLWSRPIDVVSNCEVDMTQYPFDEQRAAARAAVGGRLAAAPQRVACLESELAAREASHVAAAAQALQLSRDHGALDPQPDVQLLGETTARLALAVPVHLEWPSVGVPGAEAAIGTSAGAAAHADAQGGEQTGGGGLTRVPGSSSAARQRGAAAPPPLLRSRRNAGLHCASRRAACIASMRQDDRVSVGAQAHVGVHVDKDVGVVMQERFVGGGLVEVGTRADFGGVGAQARVGVHVENGGGAEVLMQGRSVGGDLESVGAQAIVGAHLEEDEEVLMQERFVGGGRGEAGVLADFESVGVQANEGMHLEKGSEQAAQRCYVEIGSLARGLCSRCVLDVEPEGSWASSLRQMSLVVQPFFKEREVHSPEFRVKNITVQTKDVFTRSTAQQFNEIVYSVVLQRHPHFYVMNFVLPMVALTGLAVSTMWMNPGNIGPRVNSGTKMLLCVVSIIFITARGRPAIHGDIWMDRFQSHCLALHGGRRMSAVLESLCIDWLQKASKNLPWFPKVDTVDSVLRALICCATTLMICYDASEIKRYNVLDEYASFQAGSTRLLVGLVYIIFCGMLLASFVSFGFRSLPTNWQHWVVGKSEDDSSAKPESPGQLRQASMSDSWFRRTSWSHTPEPSKRRQRMASASSSVECVDLQGSPGFRLPGQLGFDKKSQYSLLQEAERLLDAGWQFKESNPSSVHTTSP
ncbi:unnamed protein product [Prorocentrum cordatum]|uniref:Neurotransmitter-gated ion-channel ligand-binding domain-containing protein n=1 Tax=Prorocentrum cordatum TaxID=2364126 RepID=A0ABN9U9S8_9DINO|nr:unnamed protein product [Polarella glacialis]